uniref:Cyclin N-terminal domain-containing protein n=1 Tax=Polytomella parva TaxID=51329 RepID=A0A7S0URM8_9CHLO|mmetsp:Transcript_19110/g.34575  ORF Transcript_19110/g.34575 Transcript_19110/m.34575 type:complete len:374 (+) Transcript_19110:96-1217(+)
MFANTADHAQLHPRNALGDITNYLPARDAFEKESLKYPLDENVDVSLSSLLKKQTENSSAQAPVEILPDPRLIDNSRTSEGNRKRKRLWKDVDSLNHDDPQACSHYAISIMEYLRKAEQTRRASPSYFNRQTDILPRMRLILVDWLVEVSEEFKLSCDTLFQSINYFDRYLSVFKVSRNQLQLVGITSMWVASKFEEVYPPTASEFSYITDYTYRKEELIKMEESILKELNYELAVPTAKTFLRRLLQVCEPNDELHYLSNYLTEVSLMDHKFLAYLPSQIAASAVFLANLMFNQYPWTATLEHYSGYHLKDFSKCLELLNYVLLLTFSRGKKGVFFTLYDKYANEKFLGVSKMQPIPQESIIKYLEKYLDYY